MVVRYFDDSSQYETIAGSLSKARCKRFIETMKAEDLEVDRLNKLIYDMRQQWMIHNPEPICADFRPLEPLHCIPRALRDRKWDDEYSAIVLHNKEASTVYYEQLDVFNNAWKRVLNDYIRLNNIVLPSAVDDEGNNRPSADDYSYDIDVFPIISSEGTIIPIDSDIEKPNEVY